MRSGQKTKTAKVIGRTGLINTPHVITACYGSPAHCMSHGIDELSDNPYRSCLECGHLFAIEQDLIRAHNRLLGRMNLSEYWHNFAASGSEIFSCPFCTHDW